MVPSLLFYFLKFYLYSPRSESEFINVKNARSSHVISMKIRNSHAHGAFQLFCHFFTHSGIYLEYGTNVGDSVMLGVDDSCDVSIITDYNVPFRERAFRKIYVCICALILRFSVLYITTKQPMFAQYRYTSTRVGIEK